MLQQGLRLQHLVAGRLTRVLERRADNLVQELDHLGQALLASAKRRVEDSEAGLKGALEKLHLLSPLACLGRGYSIAFKAPGRSVVRDASQVAGVHDAHGAAQTVGDIQHPALGIERRGARTATHLDPTQPFAGLRVDCDDAVAMLTDDIQTTTVRGNAQSRRRIVFVVGGCPTEPSFQHLFVRGTRRVADCTV